MGSDPRRSPCGETSVAALVGPLRDRLAIGKREVTRGMRVTVVGYDTLGEATARAMRRFGHEVQVIDADVAAQARASEAGFLPGNNRAEITFICLPTKIG